MKQLSPRIPKILQNRMGIKISNRNNKCLQCTQTVVSSSPLQLFLYHRPRGSWKRRAILSRKFMISFPMFKGYFYPCFMFFWGVFLGGVLKRKNNPVIYFPAIYNFHWMQIIWIRYIINFNWIYLVLWRNILKQISANFVTKKIIIGDRKSWDF